MPRLAPVKSSVRRGALDEEGIQVLSFFVMPGLVPGIRVLLRRIAGSRGWSSYTKTRFALKPGHDDHFRDRAAPCSRLVPALRGGIRCGRAGGTGGRARIRNVWGGCASRSTLAGAARRR